MYIDFHTHAFTDAIAERAITKLEGTLLAEGYTDDVPAATRGTIGELLEKMDIWGVDKAVVLNIATKPPLKKRGLILFPGRMKLHLKPISKRLFSLLLAVVLVLGLPLQAMAATNVGSSETTATQPTDATEPVSAEASDPTEPVEPEETTTPTEATEETTVPTEAPEPTAAPEEPTEAPAEPTKVPANTNTSADSKSGSALPLVAGGAVVIGAIIGALTYFFKKKKK